MGVALACQVLLLPAVCFGLVVLFDLPALLGIGMLMLAASPGGTTANLFSHHFRGDVALNITLTAINTVIAVVTLPLITGFAIRCGSGRRSSSRSWWSGSCSTRSGTSATTSPTSA